MGDTKTKGPVFDPGLCRCCGSIKKCRVLNVEYERLGEKEVYSDIIMDCFGLLLSHMDGKPKERLICATCVVRLREAYTFRKQVLHCEEAFLQARMYDADYAEKQATLDLNVLDDLPKFSVELKAETDEGLTSPVENASHDADYEINFDDQPLTKLVSKPLKKEKANLLDLLDNSQITVKTKSTLKAKAPPAKKAKLKIKEKAKPSPSKASAKTPKKKKEPGRKASRKSEPEPESGSELRGGGLESEPPTQPWDSAADDDDQIQLIDLLPSSMRAGFPHLKVKKLTPSPRVPALPMSKLQQRSRERDPSYMKETNILTIVEFSHVCPFRCRHNHLLCYYCLQTFTDPRDLRDHTATAHHPKKFRLTEHKKMIKIDLARIDCRLCDAKIDDLDAFKAHITTVHSKKYYFDCKESVLPFRLNGDVIKCALCDEKFPYFHALNKHMNEHFSNYVCETCGLGFVDMGRFVMHQQRHEDGAYPCATCGKVFKSHANRDLHVDRMHNRRGRVYCPKCDAQLMSYYQKLKHLVEVHGEQPLRLPCDLCERVFDSRRMLTLHKRKEHLKDYRYHCQYCGQKFFTSFALKNHIPTHTGERNFKCKVCEKTYPRNKTLKDHMRIHTNDRRYRCHVCGQAFIQNCSLKGHVKSQHPEYG